MTDMGLSLVSNSVGGASLTDAELVERARAGEPWADGAIYRRYGSFLANVAARMLRSRSEAEDVLHDVFVDILTELPSLRDPSALKPWLLRRVVHRVHRRFRRRRWWRLLGKEPARELTLESLASPGCPPEVRVELSELDRALDTLPDRQRIAWVLHRIEGEPLATVALVCDVSLATAKRDLAAAQNAIASTRSLEDP